MTTKIAVFGAGAIGCWVGGRLAAGGAAVTLIGRARVIDELRSGLRVSELGVPNDRVWVVTPTLATDASAAADADLLLVTVKSAATADAGRELAAVVREGAVIASLQNGVRNAQVLRDALPGRTVLAGMVPFNVVRRAAGEYHRGTSGTLMIEASDAAASLAEACRAAELPLEPRDDMTAVQWGKLVMNLNNAINALSGVPLMDQLSDRDFRRCLAAAQREAIALLRAANQPIARLLRLPPSWIAGLLPMPDAIFRRVATRVASVDPHARSSMQDDFIAGRTTEVDYIQGEIVALAEKLGRDAPVNRTLVRLIKEAEAGGRRDFSGRELLATIGPAGV